MCACLTCTYVCTPHAGLVLTEAREGVRSPRVLDSCEQNVGNAGAKLRSFQRAANAFNHSAISAGSFKYVGRNTTQDVCAPTPEEVQQVTLGSFVKAALKACPSRPFFSRRISNYTNLGRHAEVFESGNKSLLPGDGTVSLADKTLTWDPQGTQ